MGAAEDLAIDRKKGVAFAKTVGRLLLARHGHLLGARRGQDVVHGRGRLNGRGVGAILEPVGACAVAFGHAAGRWVIAFGACLCLELQPRANRRARLPVLAQLGCEIRVHQDGLPNLVAM